MEIRKEKKDSALSMAIEGRIDTTTAPQLETELKADLDGVTDLQIVVDVVDVGVGDLRNMYQAGLAALQGHKSAEFCNTGDLAL